MTDCDECGKLVCPLRGTPGVHGCNQGASHDILARAYRDRPGNEDQIRGIGT